MIKLIYIVIATAILLAGCGGADEAAILSEPKDPTVWTISKGKSKMDDTPTAFITLISTDMIAGYLHLSRPELSIQCVERKVSVWFDPGVSSHPELGRETYTVLYRIDQEKAVTVMAAQATNGHSLHIGSAPLAKRLLKSKHFEVQFTPFSANRSSSGFATAKTSDAIAPVRDGCPKAGL